jgi:hypothetical protein
MRKTVHNQSFKRTGYRQAFYNFYSLAVFSAFNCYIALSRPPLNSIVMG